MKLLSYIKQFVFVLAIASAFTTQAATITVKHASGETVVPVEPKKVVVFDLAVLDIMQALGQKAVGVPKAGHLPKNLSEYGSDKVVKVGSFFEPDYEKVAGLSPDLIIVAGRSKAKYPELAKIAPTIDLTVDSKDLYNSVVNNTNTIAAIFNKQEQAKTILAKLSASIQTLKAKASKAGTAMIVLTTGGKVSTFGQESRFGVIHDTFGFDVADKSVNVTNHGKAASFEYIYQINPDWLFVIDRDAAIGREGVSAKALLDNELMHKTKVWKNNHIVYLNSVNWYVLSGAGLTSMQEDVDQITQILDKK